MEYGINNNSILMCLHGNETSALTDIHKNKQKVWYQSTIVDQLDL